MVVSWFHPILHPHHSLPGRGHDCSHLLVQLHRHKEIRFKAVPEKQQRELGSLKKQHPKYVLRNLSPTDACWKRVLWSYEFGAAYILLLELFIGLKHGSEKSRSDGTNPVFTQATFSPASTTVNILREGYSEEKTV